MNLYDWIGHQEVKRTEAESAQQTKDRHSDEGQASDTCVTADKGCQALISWSLQGQLGPVAQW